MDLKLEHVTGVNIDTFLGSAERTLLTLNLKLGVTKNTYGSIFVREDLDELLGIEYCL